MIIIIIKALVCVVVIIIAGYKLSKYADIISDRTGLGKIWIGLILLATVTSLPEMVTGISSVLIVKATDLAIGDIFGSCVFNLLIISLLEFLYKPGRILEKGDKSHILTASLGIPFYGIASVSILLADKINIFSIYHIGIYSIVIFIGCLWAMRLVYLFSQRHQVQQIETVVDDKHTSERLSPIYFRAFVASVFVIGAGIWLPAIADEIAGLTGLGRTFIGSIFLGMATSLPEIVVSVASLRLGAVDLALGNLFGSNLFNLLIIFIDDLFYFQGPILSYVSTNHTVTAFLGIAMTVVAIAGLLYRSKKTIIRFGIDILVMTILYFAGMYILFKICVN